MGFGCLCALVVCQSLSACPHLCLSVVLQGQPTSFPRQQQVSMEQQAGRQMVQGQRGRVTSLSIKLSPVAPSATGSGTGSCSTCSQLCLLPSMPDASPRFSLCVPIPGSMVGTGASPAGWDELLRDATPAAGDRKYPAALCGAGRLWESGAQQHVRYQQSVRSGKTTLPPPPLLCTSIVTGCLWLSRSGLSCHAAFPTRQ